MSESKISQILTESINKKIILMILFILLILPFIDDDYYDDDSDQNYRVITSYFYSFFTIYSVNNNFINSTINSYFSNSSDPNFPIINITYNGALVFTNSSLSNSLFRPEEIRYSYTNDGSLTIVYSCLGLNQMVAICDIFKVLYVAIIVGLLIILLDEDAKKNVLYPIEVLIEIIGKIAQDPIGAHKAKNLRNGVKAELLKDVSENGEIKIIEASIIKISTLLAIGFGNAGSDIIKCNLLDDNMNTILRGKRIKAIFGFCDIRDFVRVNEALQEKTILYVNNIALAVHSTIDKFGGSVNKNIGDAFLSVWKLCSGNNQDHFVDNNYKSFENYMADSSILGFLSVIKKINRNKSILAYKEDADILKQINGYKVSMGFGLHIGWAIEGAIGSKYKIDASYLSPNVNMAARLEGATKQYGVSILISGEFYDLLSDNLKPICKLIDIVTVKGSIHPVRLYTVYVNLNISPSTKKGNNTYGKKMQNKHDRKIRMFYKNVKTYDSIGEYVTSKQTFKELLLDKRPKIFNDLYEEGLKSYIDGRWENARQAFKKCLEIDQFDGPTKCLYNYIDEYNFIAPIDWKGYRELTSK